MKTLPIVLLAAAVGVAAVAGAAVEVPKKTEVIDGRKTTIALAVAHQLVGLIPNETVKELLNVILDVFAKEDFDYWSEVKDEVEALVGDYINLHNMHQVEIYQEDLERLMKRYNEAPVESDTYPDKNAQAAALSASVISHRYLTEAADQNESMILHFQDIASIHVLVLKDAAETYSQPSLPPSRWWVDLDEELSHNLKYGRSLKEDLRKWRLNQLTCETDLAGFSCTMWEWLGVTCYDYVTAKDLVTGEESTCKELRGRHDCDSHCSNFATLKETSVDQWEQTKVTSVLESWEELKKVASANAVQASRFYDPVRSR
ncbi:uncharacterized protein LOC143034512 [Oratosquilla oratoria]|uniref:uncharacterized protein LOC143034512 n=1 Tax=Oratosquilla oratoria TaxID=337810 RepID=UPI003F7596D6